MIGDVRAAGAKSAAPTVSELLRGIANGFVVLAGAVGMGREVRRVLHVRDADELQTLPGEGDLVVHSAERGERQDGDQCLRALLSAGVVAILTDTEPKAATVQAAERSGTPVLATIGATDTEQLHAALLRTVQISQSVIHRERAEIHREFSELLRAGAPAIMLIQRLVELSGKSAALHGPNSRVEQYVPAALQGLDKEAFRRVITLTEADVQRWLVNTADASINNLLSVEVPSANFVHLFAPVWVDGEFAGGASLVGRPDDVSGRDRVSLLTAARTLAAAMGVEAPELPRRTQGSRLLILAMRPAAATLDALASAVQRLLAEHEPAVLLAREYVGIALPDDAGESWQRRARLRAWQATLTEEIGPVSLGFSDHDGSADPRRALVNAAEAVLVGDHLYGPGHVTSYAEAQLSRFLGGARGAPDLCTLYERVIGRLAHEDARRDRSLVETLDVYCEAVSTVATAERLRVHRNTVLYRLKQIQDVTSMDLSDGTSRLLLHLGLAAGRFAGQARRQIANGDISQPMLNLMRLGQPSPQARTA